MKKSDKINKLDYETRASLRLWHPDLECNEISKELGIRPTFCRNVGSVRKTPKGHILDGVNLETYWYSEFELSSCDSFNDCLWSVVNLLLAREEFLIKFHSSGGRGDISMGIFLNSNSGFKMNKALAQAIGNLGLDLSFNLYTPEELRTGESVR